MAVLSSSRMAVSAAIASGLALCGPAVAEPSVPACRLDASRARLVDDTLQRAAAAFTRLGRPLPFTRVVVNPTAPVTDGRTLEARIVTDASESTVGKDGCVRGATALVGGEPLDGASVRGGCVASGDRLEVQCSASAVETFGRMARDGRANPALLYVLAHELGHILQRRAGQYQGRVESIDLAAPPAAKIEVLRRSCDPADTSAEEDADRMAVQVLAALVRERPYREPLFSEQGSMLWSIDQLNLAANTWRKLAAEREFISQRRPHPSYVATEFPMPEAKVRANAKKFVCDVLTRTTGNVLHPGRSISHPALEERMARVAAALGPIAATLPKAGADKDHRPVAVLQEQLSPIFSHIYRENGLYLEAVQREVCTRVNSDQPAMGCR